MFNLASAVIENAQPIDFGIKHVGEAVPLVVLSIKNDAPADPSGFSEKLNASFGAVDTRIITNAAIIELLGPQAIDNGSMQVGINTSSAAVIDGSLSVNFQSDGDGGNILDPTGLAPQAVNVVGQVNNFAIPMLFESLGDATFVPTGTDEYLLDFGDVAVGLPNPTAELDVLNDVSAPADQLAGDWTLSATDFVLSGFSAFDDLLAGAFVNGFGVQLSTLVEGLFTGQITLNPLSQNSSGFSGPLSDVIINVRGNVIPEPATFAVPVFGGLLSLGRRRAA